MDSCSWCGVEVEPDDGFRAFEPAGSRRSVFCRLEHVVPWAMQGPAWGAGELEEDAAVDGAAESCALCEARLGEVHVLLVRHRGEFRIADGFCSVDHLREWATKGGRWA